MVHGSKQPVLVIVQLTGGNDFMDTLVPYTSDVYYDNRPTVAVGQDQVLPIDDEVGFNPSAGLLKELYDEGSVAIVQGIGYPDSSRSHFRSMDIWHTCEPEEIVNEGWLGKAIRELDPHKENVLTGINIGRGLPRAMAAPGVPVTSVGNLDSYGIMGGMAEERQREEALEVFKSMYAQAIGTRRVHEYLMDTAHDVLVGADMLKAAPDRYSSDVEYANSPIAQSLRDVARVHLAGLGARVFYTQHGGYDTHASQVARHPVLLRDLSAAISDFIRDLRDHDASDEVVLMVFSEFGRRFVDNGSGTDHGAGGGAFIVGDRVKGGLYSEYPPLSPDQWVEGDLRHTIDFRGVYGTLLEQWLGVDPAAVIRGSFEGVSVFAG